MLSPTTDGVYLCADTTGLSFQAADEATIRLKIDSGDAWIDSWTLNAAELNVVMPACNP